MTISYDLVSAVFTKNHQCNDDTVLNFVLFKMPLSQIKAYIIFNK